MRIGHIVVAAFIALLVASMVCSSVRAHEPKNNTPQSLLLELKEKILEADAELFQGFTYTYTMQQKNALANKIDVVIGMFDDGQHGGAIAKLENDIAPKVNICQTARARARSWLSDDPELDGVVREFAAGCQELIQRIISLADQSPNL